jgi:hypothetical protein
MTHHDENHLLNALNLWRGRLPSAAVGSIGKHAVNVNFALRWLHRKFFFQAAASASYNSATFAPKYLYPNGFLATFWTWEEFGQTFLWNADNLAPSSPHHRILL